MEEMQALAREPHSRKSASAATLSHQDSTAYDPYNYKQLPALPQAHLKSRKRGLPTWLARIWSFSWLIEVLSCITAALALTATVITLALHNNRPLPQWPHLLSINAVISIFSAILKAALTMPVAEGISQLKWLWFSKPRSLIDIERFDSASRGPWGSLILLLRVGKHYLAVIGACITIVALAIDPFTQQIIQYYDCLQAIDGVIASVPRTNSYTVAGPKIGAKGTNLDGPMTTALYIGLLSPPTNASSNIPVGCSTGNCTFVQDNGATHSSLAMCSSCKDVTYLALRNTSTDDLQAYYLAYDPDVEGPHQNFTYGNTTQGPVTNLETYMSTFSVYDTAYNQSVYEFDALMLNLLPCTNFTYGGCTYEAFAAHCELFPCVKTYGVNISNSVLSENVISTIRVPTLNFADNFTLGTERTLRDGAWQDCRPSTEPSATNPIGVPVSITEFNVSNYYPEDYVWIFGSSARQAMQEYLYKLFSGNKLEPSESYGPNATEGDPWLKNLYRNGSATLDSVNTYMDGLTNAITNVIRTNGDTPPSGYAKGTTLGNQTCIHVQWAWLSLPATLLVLAIAFLIATIVSTRSWQPTWKSSSLALLFHGLSPETRAAYGPLSNIETMEDAAEATKARLTPDRAGSGWRFVVR